MTGSSQSYLVDRYVSISQNPCDWDPAKVDREAMSQAGTLKNYDFCYVRAGNENAIQFEVTNGAVSWGICKIIPGKLYYLNIRFQEPLPGSNNKAVGDSCQIQSNGDGRLCGGLIQINGIWQTSKK